MAITSGYFNSVNGDRKYNADQMSEYFEGIINEGVCQHIDGGLAVTAGTGLSVNVAAGKAFIGKKWIRNDASLTLTISAASASYARIDAVVLRRNNTTRTCQIVVKSGTPAASPAAPSMTRAGGVYEMCLAYVNVAANATSVTVTDKRSNSSVCGWAAVAQATSGEVDQMLNDMKTGFDGVVYDSPGAAVRACDQLLQDEIDDVKTSIKNNPKINGIIHDALEISNLAVYGFTPNLQLGYNNVEESYNQLFSALNLYFRLGLGDVLNFSNSDVATSKIYMAVYDENLNYVQGVQVNISEYAGSYTALRGDRIYRISFPTALVNTSNITITRASELRTAQYKINHAILNETVVYKPNVASNTSDTSGKWWTYKKIYLKAGATYKVKTTVLQSTTGIGFALLDPETMQVSNISTSGTVDANNSYEVTLTPTKNSWLLFKYTAYKSGQTGTQLTVYRLNQTSISDGDHVTFDDYSGTALSFEITISVTLTEKMIIDGYPGCDIITPDGKGYVIVNQDGTGDYTSVVTAVESVPENTPIIIMPGVYDGTIEAFTKRIVLIGVDRNTCILRSKDGRYDYPPVNGSCGYLENLTLISEYVQGESQTIDGTTPGAYAFHCENAYGMNKALEFHHCTLISDFFPALGVGLRKNMKLIVDDCILENRQVAGRGNYSNAGSLGALYFHDAYGDQGDSYVTLKNNLLKSTLGYSMTPYKANGGDNHVYCEYIQNVLYDAINHYSNNIWYRNDPFDPSTGNFTLTIGFGNSNNDMNNNA